MKVVIDGRKASLDPRKTLGAGGEATVFLWLDRGTRRAVKIYATGGPARAAKVKRLIALGAALPRCVAAPEHLALDEASGAVVGFAMPALEPGFEPVAMLARASFRTSIGVGLAGVAGFLERLVETLEQIHALGAVVGDLNDQNELVRPSDGAVAFIDVDSFQIPGFGCEVATEAHLDPRLFGPDPAAPCLTAGGATRTFDRASDWYALAVIALRSLALVHPFGGTALGMPTLAARALARRSVFGAGVALPDGVRHRLAALPHALTDWFATVFERDARGPLPRDVLAALLNGGESCATCGLERARTVARCPACPPRTSLPTGHRRSANLGAPTSVELCAASGAIVALAVDGGLLLAVAREAELLVVYRVRLDAGHVGGADRTVLDVRCDPRRVSPTVMASGGGLSGAVVVAWPDDGVVVILDAATGARIATTATEVAAGRPALAAGNGALHRVAGGVLMRSLIASEAGATAMIDEVSITTVVSEQTTLAPAAGGVLVIESSLGAHRYARMVGRRRVELDAPPLDPGERLVDQALAADARGTALIRHTRAVGADHVRLSLFDADGASVVERALAENTRAARLTLEGGLLHGAAHIVAIDGGLVREDLKTGEERHFVVPAVAEGDRLALTHAGLAVARGARVHLLKLTT